MRFIRGLLAFVASCGVLLSQGRPALLVSTEYRPLQRAFRVSPGQVVTLRIAGLSGSRVPTEFQGDYPIAIEGVRVVVRVSSAEPIYSRMVGVTAEECTQGPSGCDPTSTVTAQIPFELGRLLGSSGEGAGNPILTVESLGARVVSIPLEVVTDQIHILNNCDETAIFVGIFSTVPQNRCTHAVQHLDASLVTADNPATAGETIMLWVLGAGMPGANALQGSPETFDLRYVPSVTFDYRPNAAVSPPRSGKLTNPALTAYTFARTGLTQITFVVPSPPAGGTLRACDAGTVQSNLTVTLSGPESHDGAAICVRP